MWYFYEVEVNQGYRSRYCYALKKASESYIVVEREQTDFSRDQIDEESEIPLARFRELFSHDLELMRALDNELIRIGGGAEGRLGGVIVGGDDETVVDPVQSACPTRSLQQGTLLNDVFRIEERLSAGGIGEVYRATQVHGGDDLAIKIIVLDGDDRRMVEAMYRQQARVMTRIVSPAVAQVKLLACEPALELYYLASEFVPGESLLDRATRQSAGPGELRALTCRVLSGLQAAHAQGVVHRDVSPDKIILPGGDITEAKLIGFGLTKDLRLVASNGGVTGMLCYVAPEQLDGVGEVGPWSDLYSLALSGITFATGQPVEMGAAAGEAAASRRTPIDLSAVPEDLQPLFSRMLDYDWQVRPTSADEALAMLDSGSPVRVTTLQDMSATGGDDSLADRAGEAAAPAAAPPVRPTESSRLALYVFDSDLFTFSLNQEPLTPQKLEAALGSRKTVRGLPVSSRTKVHELVDDDGREGSGPFFCLTDYEELDRGYSFTFERWEGAHQYKPFDVKRVYVLGRQTSLGEAIGDPPPPFNAPALPPLLRDTPDDAWVIIDQTKSMGDDVRGHYPLSAHPISLLKDMWSCGAIGPDLSLGLLEPVGAADLAADDRSRSDVYYIRRGNDFTRSSLDDQWQYLESEDRTLLKMRPFQRLGDPATPAETLWHVLSSHTVSMEVFRMTDQERRVMDLVRVVDGKVELLHEALDGPSWIYNPPPHMGVTEEGTRLWEPEGQATIGFELTDLPSWAEPNRDRIRSYLNGRH